MNILLWILQVLVAWFCVVGAVWRFLNYDQAAKGIVSVQALSYGTWNAIGVFEIGCSLGLILPGAFKVKPSLTPIAAACLAVELLLVTGLHVHYFGFQFQATNPAAWSFTLAILSAFVAYGRLKLRLFKQKA
jgi:formate-dependent nitrite reductase membrane component NrfD